MERALLEGELVPLREKLLADEERLEMLLQQSNALEEKCQQERSHHQEAIEVCTGVCHWCIYVTIIVSSLNYQIESFVLYDIWNNRMQE